MVTRLAMRNFNQFGEVEVEVELVNPVELIGPSCRFV